MIYSKVGDSASATILPPASSGVWRGREAGGRGIYWSHSEVETRTLDLTRNILRSLRLIHQTELITAQLRENRWHL